MRVVRRPINKDLFVYIPYTADKGDCLVCPDGVLARDSNVEEEFCVREGYTCDVCGAHYVESVVALPAYMGPAARYFVKVPSEQAGERAYS